MNKTRQVVYKAEAIVLHRTYLKRGKYRFRDPVTPGTVVRLKISECSGMGVRIGGKKPSLFARKEALTFATMYQIECPINIDSGLLLYPTKDNNRDWPRSSMGRAYLEEVFLSRVNYFFDNVLYFSDKANPNNQLMSSVRPIGSEDIISIRFIIDNIQVAAQGNPLLRLLVLKFKDEAYWPKSGHVARQFRALPAESRLLFRANSLVNFGFYQEAVLIAFSILDAKVQELVESRMERECNLPQKEARKYLRNISCSRIDTMLNFTLSSLDKRSLKGDNPTLYSKIEELNTKRNRIVHSGESASREDALNSIETVMKTLAFINRNHKGDFDIPVNLLTHGGRFCKGSA